MVSPEHIDEHKPENQQEPSPTEEQQEPVAVEKKRPWLKPLMREAAIVLSLVGSFAIVWVHFTFIPMDYAMWAVVEGLLIGAVSAVLFRSWWALLVIPIAFSLGEFLAFYLMPLVISPNPFEIGDAGMAVILWAFAGPISSLFGAILGILIVKTLELVRQQ